MDFDPATMPLQAIARRGFGGHSGRLGIRFHDRGDDWIELALPWSADLVGDEAAG